MSRVGVGVAVLALGATACGGEPEPPSVEPQPADCIEPGFYDLGVVPQDMRSENGYIARFAARNTCLGPLQAERLVVVSQDDEVDIFGRVAQLDRVGSGDVQLDVLVMTNRPGEHLVDVVGKTSGAVYGTVSIEVDPRVRFDRYARVQGLDLEPGCVAELRRGYSWAGNQPVGVEAITLQSDAPWSLQGDEVLPIVLGDGEQSEVEFILRVAGTGERGERLDVTVQTAFDGLVNDLDRERIPVRVGYRSTFYLRWAVRKAEPPYEITLPVQPAGPVTVSMIGDATSDVPVHEYDPERNVVTIHRAPGAYFIDVLGDLECVQ